jgi:hypothetical protein
VPWTVLIFSRIKTIELDYVRYLQTMRSEILLEKKFRSLDRSVGIATSCELDDRGSVPRRMKRFLTFP